MTVTKHSINELAQAADLCTVGRDVLGAWAKAYLTGKPDDYLKAHKSLETALRERTPRIAVIAPLVSWKSEHPNVLIFRPVYSEYEEVKRAWNEPLPELPPHWPVELEAGAGPYATGRHLVLFFENAAPEGSRIPAAERVGVEFLNTWRARWKAAIPWLMNFASPAFRTRLAILEQDEGVSRRAILESILAHEVGHGRGLWPISTEQTEMVNLLLESQPVLQIPVLRVVCNTLSDLAADTSNAGVMSNDALIAVLIYHLLNITGCWRERPTQACENWPPLSDDSDCLGGVLVASAVLDAAGSNQGGFSQEHIRKGLLELSCLVERAIVSVRNGDVRAVVELAHKQISPLLRQLLDSSPRRLLAEDFQQRLPLQNDLLPVMLNCLRSDIA